MDNEVFLVEGRGHAKTRSAEGLLENYEITINSIIIEVTKRQKLNLLFKPVKHLMTSFNRARALLSGYFRIL